MFVEGCDGFSFGLTELQVPLGAVLPKSRVPGGQVWKGTSTLGASTELESMGVDETLKGSSEIHHVRRRPRMHPTSKGQSSRYVGVHLGTDDGSKRRKEFKGRTEQEHLVGSGLECAQTLQAGEGSGGHW